MRFMLSNRLIGSLPGDEIRMLAPHLERVELEQRQVLFDPDQFISHVYFPTTAVVSLVTPADQSKPPVRVKMTISQWLRAM